MLERIALHQTRLRTPGLGLDAKGVALGERGLVLLPTIERLVAFLAVYTRERSLEGLLPSLTLRLVRSPLGAREVAFEVAAESSDRMDRLSDVARLVGGFTFTGTGRHFVKYRDAAAPFGYDAAELVPSEAPLVVHHDRFSQAYDAAAPLDLRRLMLSLAPRPDPRARGGAGPRLVLAEPGLGPALVHYLFRSGVDGEVGALEHPPESAFDDGPRRRTLVRIAAVPARMGALLEGTPGLTSFVPRAPGVAVEVGFRHPLDPLACPVFPAAGLVLFRGRPEGGAAVPEPIVVDALPAMGDLGAFARVELLQGDGGAAAVAAVPPVLTVPLRLAPSLAPWRHVHGAWIPKEQLSLLRRLAYVLPAEALRRTAIAVTEEGAFLRAGGDVDVPPLGEPFVEVHADLFVPAGFAVVPAVAPPLLARSLGAGAGALVFLTRAGRAVRIAAEAFVPLEGALVVAEDAMPAEARRLAEVVAAEPIHLAVGPLGSLPADLAEAPRTLRDGPRSG